MDEEHSTEERDHALADTSSGSDLGDLSDVETEVYNEGVSEFTDPGSNAGFVERTGQTVPRAYPSATPDENQPVERNLPEDPVIANELSLSPARVQGDISEEPTNLGCSSFHQESYREKLSTDDSNSSSSSAPATSQAPTDDAELATGITISPEYLCLHVQGGGAALLRCAESAEARLAAASHDVSSTATSNDEQVLVDIVAARLASQLVEEPASLDHLHSKTSPRSSGSMTMIGQQLAARAFVSPQLEPIYKGTSRPTIAGAGPSTPTVVAKVHGIVAVGASTGATHVLVPPAPGSSGGFNIHILEDRGATGDRVTAVALGKYGSGLLAVSGHASGRVRLWETRPGSRSISWILAKTVQGVHAVPITALAVLDGAPTTYVLSADAHGRLVCHNVNKHLSLAVQALAGFARQLAGTGVPAVASPCSLLSLQAAGQDPGVIVALTPLTTPPHTAKSVATTSSSTASPPKALHATAEGGQFVLIVASKALFLGGINADGVLSVLHVFFPPEAARTSGVMGYAAWRLHDGSFASRGDTHATVAVAWGTTVSVYGVALALRASAQQQAHPTDDTTAVAAPTTLPAPVLLSSFNTEGTVRGVGFLGPGALAVVTSDGETALDIAVWHPAAYAPPEDDGFTNGENGAHESGYSNGVVTHRDTGSSGPRLVERLRVPDWMIDRQFGIPEDPSFHSALSGGAEQVLVLTSRGVVVLHLMTWQQRLSSLVAQERHETALLSAVKLFCAAQRPTIESELEIRLCWPADVAHPSDIDVIRRQLVTLVCSLLDSKIPVAVQEINNVEAERLADIAINACLLMHDTDVLFAEVAPRFLSSPHVRSQLLSAAFLERLEPRILTRELPSLAPEVMQALVAHFVQQDHLLRVERLVLNLDLLSLDLNQLIPLCIRHDLYGALIHIFNGALQDYQTPAALLLRAAHTARQNAMHAITQPTALDAETVLKSSKVVQLVFRLLVYLRGCLLGRAYPPGTGLLAPAQQQMAKLHAVAFLLQHTTASLWNTWNAWESLAHHSVDEAAVTDSVTTNELTDLRNPYSALRFLCDIDAQAVLAVLRDGLQGWDALMGDVIEACPEIAPYGDHSGLADRTVAQASVDAAAFLLEENEKADDNHTESAQCLAWKKHRKAALLRFIAEHLASSRADSTRTVLLHVLRFLAQQEDIDLKSEPLSFDDRESIFTDVVAHSANAKNAQVRGDALTLAWQAGFRQAEARVHRAARAHDKALECLLADTRHLEAPFRYIHDVLVDPETTEPERREVTESTMASIPRLVRLNARSTALLVAHHFKDRHVMVIEALASHPDDQFAYLQAAIKGRGTVAESGGTTAGSVSLATLQGHLPSVLLRDKSVSSLYVRLLCRFQPSAVLQFLQSHDGYDVEQCLKHCEEHGIRRAAAFLLERRGDAGAALTFYLEEVHHANAAFVESALNSGLGNSWAQRQASEEARRNTVAMCVRFSQDSNSLESDPVQRMWLDVVERYIKGIGALRQQRRRCQDDELRRRIDAVEGIFISDVEEILSQMAGYVPLQAVVSAIMNKYNEDPLGDFKATFMSLLSACNHDLTILRCASRITGADAIQLLAEGYAAGCKHQSMRS